MILKKFKIYHSIAIILFLGISCAPKPQNKNLPPSLDEQTVYMSDEQARLHQKWVRLAEALHIGTNDSSVSDLDLKESPDKSVEDISLNKLTEELKAPSGLLTNPQYAREYKSLLSEVAQGYVEQAFATRCAKIVNFEKWSNSKKITNPKADQKRLINYLEDDLDSMGQFNATVYKLSYQLMKNKLGEPESQVRIGLLSIPNSDKERYPILAYAHGGDKGLSYIEIASLLGRQQKNHIIVAPTYPGEPWCKGFGVANGGCDEYGYVAKPLGHTSPWDNDADELLGMHHCITRAIEDDHFDAPSELKELLKKRYRPLQVKKEVGGLAAIISQKLITKLSHLWEENKERLGQWITTLVPGSDEISEEILVKALAGVIKFVNNPDYRNDHDAFAAMTDFKPLAEFFSSTDINSTIEYARFLPIVWKILRAIPEISPDAKTIKDLQEPLSLSLKTLLKEKSFQNELRLIFDYLGVANLQLGELEFDGKPASLIAGSSRGGLVVAVALAKIGSHMEAIGRSITKNSQLEEWNGGFWQASLGEGYGGMPARFSCSAFISAPSSILIGRLRLLLEYMVKGQFKHTYFNQLPGLSKLHDMFEDYLADETNSSELLHQKVVDIVKRDAPFLGPYMLTALKNWNYFDIAKLASDNPAHARLPMGAVLYMHGEDDKVVPFEQSFAAFNVLYKQTIHPEVLSKTMSMGIKTGEKNGNIILEDDHSLKISFRAFRGQNHFKKMPDYYHHLDKYFLQSTSFIPHNLLLNNVHSFRHHANQTKMLYEARGDSALLQVANELFLKAWNDDLKAAKYAKQMLDIYEGKLPRREGRLIVAAGQLDAYPLRLNRRTGDVEDVLDRQSDPLTIFELWRYGQCESVL